MSNENGLRTGLWKNEPGKPAGYGGKITVTDPGEYWVNLYKNERKETDKHPDLNLVLKPKGEPRQQSANTSSSDEFSDDLIPF